MSGAEPASRAGQAYFSTTSFTKDGGHLRHIKAWQKPAGALEGGHTPLAVVQCDLAFARPGLERLPDVDDACRAVHQQSDFGRSRTGHHISRRGDPDLSVEHLSVNNQPIRMFNRCVFLSGRLER